MTDWARLPPLSALRAFAAYAETGAVTEAGAALNVSHAAISQQLRNLEDRLGCALVERGGRRMVLTEDGAILAAALARGFGAIAEAVDALTGQDAERPVQISTTPGFAAAWLMPRLACFQAEHPEVSLMIDPSPEVRTLSPGGVDVALRFGAGDWPGHEVSLLVATPIVTVAAPDLLAATADRTKLPWLQEFGTTEVSRYAAPVGRAGRVTSLPGNLLLEALRAGQGAASVTRITVAADIAAGRLVELGTALDAGDARPTGYWIVTRPGVARAPLKTLLTWLRREARAGGLSNPGATG